MRFEGVLLLLALTIFQVHGICIFSAGGNVLRANAALDLFSTKRCGTFKEWELVPVPGSTNYYIKHVSTQSFLLPLPDRGITLDVILEDKLTPEYIWIETEVGEAASGVIQQHNGVYQLYMFQSQATLEYLSVDSLGVGLSATAVGDDEQFIKIPV